MKRDSKRLLGTGMALFALFVALSILNIVEKAQPYRLTLTNEGCVFAQSIGLNVDKTKGQCSTIAAFAPFTISSGGVLFLTDGNSIEVTASMLLATAELDIRLPFTPSQQTGMYWFYGWLFVAAAAASYTIYINYINDK